MEESKISGNSVEKPTISGSNGKTFFSSMGLGFRADDAADRRMMERATPFVCGLCEYPVMATWKFCPACGAGLVWKGIGNKG